MPCVHPLEPAATAFTIPDFRCPGEPMAALPLKLPAAAVTRLQATAERLGTSRSALGRALLLEGLERLNTARDCPG